jgi:hypothetical protein
MRPRLLEEICAKAKLDVAYSGTLATIIGRIEADDCEVFTRADGLPSSYEHYTDRPSIIRISLINVGEPLNIIWRLLHEYGHHLSGKRQAEDQDIVREKLAWKHADGLVQEYPDLILRINDYERCKEHDLETYR